MDIYKSLPMPDLWIKEGDNSSGLKSRIFELSDISGVPMLLDTQRKCTNPLDWVYVNRTVSR